MKGPPFRTDLVSEERQALLHERQLLLQLSSAVSKLLLINDCRLFGQIAPRTKQNQEELLTERDKDATVDL